MADPRNVLRRFLAATSDPEYVTFPVAGGAYKDSDLRSTLTHCCKKDTSGDWAPLCKRVKKESILDDMMWGEEGDLESKPTCKDCARKDPRHK